MQLIEAEQHSSQIIVVGDPNVFGSKILIFAQTESNFTQILSKFHPILPNFSKFSPNLPKLI